MPHWAGTLNAVQGLHAIPSLHLADTEPAIAQEVTSLSLCQLSRDSSIGIVSISRYTVGLREEIDRMILAYEYRGRIVIGTIKYELHNDPLAYSLRRTASVLYSLRVT